MNRIFIYGLNEHRKAVLEYLHQNEIMEISDFDAEENGIGRRETQKSISSFTQYIASASRALEILDMYLPEKQGMFTARTEADVSIYNMQKDEINNVNKHIYDIINAEKTIKKNLDNIGKINVKLSQITPYLALDVPMNFRGTKSTLAMLGGINGEWSEERFVNAMNDAQVGEYHFEILSSSKQHTCIWIIYPRENSDKIETALREIGFSEPSFSLSHRNTKDKYEKLEQDKKKLLSENENIIAQIKDYSQYRKEIKLFYDHLVMRKEKYEALSHVGVTDNVFIISGFVPVKLSEKLKNELIDKFDVAVDLEKAQKDEAPIAFSNNAFVEPVEGITSDYSMPSANDIDPNPIMSVFYYMFFGMMFSDAGYGLLMMIACGILGFGKVLEKSKRRAYKMFFYCGVSTTFWGIMYGSFFGDMIDTIASKFLNSPFKLQPILLNPTQKPLELLIISVAFGMIHILAALVIKFYMQWRNGDKTDAVCDTGLWILALLGISLFAAGMGLGIAVLDTVGKVMMIAGFLGIVLTGGRNNKNIIGKLFGGILSLYDITSYVGDVLSYSRLMALGLATGVIASVINVLGSLGGATVVGVIAYIAISIFGHALNFAINCLGAYVHTNRLQYVEFYQKFYEGGGKKFKPFSMNTKYFNFSKNK